MLSWAAVVFAPPAQDLDGGPQPASTMATTGYNSKHTGVRRIRQEMKELSADRSIMYRAMASEENIFNWHFVIRGPPDSDFEGGVYCGRIQLPSDYPYKPPNIILDTPNGRFRQGEKICLSISAYHPEKWHPAWGGELRGRGPGGRWGVFALRVFACVVLACGGVVF